MPPPKNKPLRIFLPIFIVVLGVIVIPLSILRTGLQQKTTPEETATSQIEAPATPPVEVATDATINDQGDTPAASTPSETPESTPSNTPSISSAEPAGADTTPASTSDAGVASMKLGARLQPKLEPTPLGSLSASPTSLMRVEFTQIGAGLDVVKLADYYRTVSRDEHYIMQQREVLVDALGNTTSIAPIAARAIRINGQEVNLYSNADLSTIPATITPVWRETAPGQFVAEIVDENDADVLRITRTYELQEESYDLIVRQEVENLTDENLRIEWVQYGPVQMKRSDSGYRLPSRRVRLGYIETPEFDPAQQTVKIDGKLTGREKYIDRWEAARNQAKNSSTAVWPDPKRFERAGELSWISQTSRYFSSTVHPLLDPDNPTGDKALFLADSVHSKVLRVAGSNGKVDKNLSVLGLEMTSKPFILEAGTSSNDLDFGLYLGPMNKRALDTGSPVYTDPSLPTYRGLAMKEIIVYNIGGLCMDCTFQPLARFLIRILMFFHDVIFQDWTLAIICLVFCVRGALHPITRRSQIGLQRFGKQMQAVAPKTKKLQEKYKDDPKRMQAEVAKLYKEEGVNFANALGCLPMFLQTPIWIALYAMLYYAFELRHEPAFYGLFQMAGNWQFMADLSVPDRFIMMPGGGFDIPLLSALWGTFTSINILPLVLGFVFFVHQKYMSPPPSATMTPEQQQQQKIMKVMMVVMFPFMLYNAPAGLTVYFITNSTLGILESRWIRSHIDKEDLEPKPKKPVKKKTPRKKVKNQAYPTVKKDPPRKHFKDR